MTDKHLAEARKILVDIAKHKGVYDDSFTNFLVTPEELAPYLAKQDRESRKLATEAHRSDLMFFANLQDEQEVTHFEPCNFCGQTKHHCNCTSTLIEIERMAKDRLARLTKEAAPEEEK